MTLLEITVVPDTKFELLKLRLEEIWSRFGYPEKLIHDSGPPYNTWEGKRYVEDLGCKMNMSTPEHPKLNAMS